MAVAVEINMLLQGYLTKWYRTYFSLHSKNGMYTWLRSQTIPVAIRKHTSNLIPTGICFEGYVSAQILEG